MEELLAPAPVPPPQVAATAVLVNMPEWGETTSYRTLSEPSVSQAVVRLPDGDNEAESLLGPYANGDILERGEANLTSRVGRGYGFGRRRGLARIVHSKAFYCIIGGLLGLGVIRYTLLGLGMLSYTFS